MDADNLEEALAALIAGIRTTLRTELTSIWLPTQLGAILLAAVIAAAAHAVVRRKFDLVSATMGWPGYVRIAVRALMMNFGVLAFIAAAGIARSAILAIADHPRTYLLSVAINLATAWVVIALLAGVIRNPAINRLVAVIAWTIAALSIVGLLDPLLVALDSRAFVLGGLRITPLLVIKTTALLLAVLWVAAAISNFLERRVDALPGLTPSVQALIGKLIRITIMTVAVIVVMTMVGIDLSVFAWFTGAVGVGIGFGLQKIVSNLVSGIILLADKSIKPGDVISVGDQSGRVTNMGARYTSVDTGDGRAILVPNEDFVTQRVINWSYADDLVRLEIKFNATYASDPRKTQSIAVAAAQSVPRVLRAPAPACHLAAFGPGAIEYVLWVWVANPSADAGAVRGAVMLALWDAFEREGVGIPKPGPTRVILEQPAS
jgi:small-conductance mechanosensitive channel